MLYPTWCCLQCVCAVHKNLQRSFFCSARVEYFSNECFISDSDLQMNTPTETSTWKWNQVRERGACRGQGTHTCAHSDQVHSLFDKQYICILYCSLFTINTWASLYTNPNLWVLTTHSYTPKIFPSSAFVSMPQNLQATKKTKPLKFPGRRNMEDVKTKPPKTAQTCV